MFEVFTVVKENVRLWEIALPLFPFRLFRHALAWIDRGLAGDT